MLGQFAVHRSITQKDTIDGLMSPCHTNLDPLVEVFDAPLCFAVPLGFSDPATL